MLQVPKPVAPVRRGGGQPACIIARVMPQATVAFWPHTSSANIASTRIRCLQVVAGLQRLGVDARLLPDKDGPDERAAPTALVLAKRYDARSVDRAVALREQAGTKLLLDLCDNHFYFKEALPIWQTRADELRRAVQAVDAVVAASPVLAEVVAEQCPQVKAVHVVPDALDEWPLPLHWRWADRWQRLRLWRFFRAHPVAAGRRLIWFGNHGSGYADGGMQDLSLIADALHEHHVRQPLTLTVVSNNAEAWQQLSAPWRLPTFYLPWSMAVFRHTQPLHDVALIPAQLNPFTRCKTNNRLATAFVAGQAVAASRLPAYEEFADLAVLDDWGVGLAALMADAADRARRVQQARERLHARYDIDTVCRQWHAVIRAVGGAQPSSMPTRTMAAAPAGQKEPHDPLVHRV